MSDGQSFLCEDSDTITRAGLRAGFAMPHECNVGGCGACRCEIAAGEVVDLYPDAPALSERDRRKGRRLGCQTQAASDLVLGFSAQPLPSFIPRPRRRRAVLTEVRQVTHDIREFRFRLDEPAAFLPGQYALIAVPGVAAWRAYSMANVVTEGGAEWHFQIRRVPGGMATSVLFDRSGKQTEFMIDGPYGNAFLREDSTRDVICVAGGSGLAPMLSVARGVSFSPKLTGRRVRFFMGGRTADDIAGENELRALPGFGDTLSFHPVISTPDAPGAWRGAKGLVHEAAAEALDGRLGDFEWYFAGPPPMVAATESMLDSAGVSREQIHFDRYF
jgi:toluene monooxygenase electron transfer component